MDIPIGDNGTEVHKEQSLIEAVAYRDIWGKGIDSYLHYMYERLLLMKELLKDTGSIYVHCDWRMNFYLRSIMNEVFGAENFRNEIIWYYKGGALTGVQRHFPRKHDTIFWYVKSEHYYFEQPRYAEISKDMIRRWGQYLDDEGNIRFGQIEHERPTYERLYRKFVRKHGRAPSKDDIAWRVEGSIVRDVWDDIPEVGVFSG